MSEIDTSTAGDDEPGLYEIRIKGRLTDRWAAWFEGLTITGEENGDTLLTGPVVITHACVNTIRPSCMACSEKCVI